jgi:hypothetical protein
VRIVQRWWRGTGLRGDPPAELPLLAAGCTLLVSRLSGQPVRQVLNALPFMLLFGVTWWAMRGQRPARRLVGLALLSVLCVWPAFGGWAPPAVGGMDEDGAVWSISLQQPDHRIGVSMRLPDAASAQREARRLHVRLAQPYRGGASLRAKVNGTDLGALTPPRSDRDQTEPLDVWSRVVVVPAEVLAARPVTEIVLAQDRPDRALRIIVHDTDVGGTLGRAGVRFFDGAQWYSGLPSAADGRLASGRPHVELLSISRPGDG